MRSLIIAAVAALAFASAGYALARISPVHGIAPHCLHGRLCDGHCIPKRQTCRKETPQLAGRPDSGAGERRR
jgi:hypothetical protein